MSGLFMGATGGLVCVVGALVDAPCKSHDIDDQTVSWQGRAVLCILS
jgi:hypothetical protein